MSAEGSRGTPDSITSYDTATTYDLGARRAGQGGRRAPRWHRTSGPRGTERAESATWMALVLGVALGATLAVPIPKGIMIAFGVILALMVLGSVRGRRSVAILFAVAVASSHGAIEHAAFDAAPRGPFTGVATLRSDPAPRGGGVSVVVEVEGHRYEARAWGRTARALAARLSGETVVVSARRVDMPERMRAWARSRHVVGRLRVDMVVGSGPGTPLAEAANRVHRALDHAARSWDPTHRALVAGLVLGNDKHLAPEVREAFQRSGLSHLTAASGQNLALLTGLVAPVLARRRRMVAVVTTLLLIGWFATLTRFEPSVLRAGLMAAIALVTSSSGDPRPRMMPLAVTVSALILVDPLLVGSVSLWLSATATAGLVVFTGPLSRGLGAGLDRWGNVTEEVTMRSGVPDSSARTRGPMGGVLRALGDVATATVAAQLGVLAVSTWVFGLPSSISLLTNLAAVPVAGAVMISGPFLVAVGAAGIVPGAILEIAARVALGWLVLVAETGARWRPPLVVDVLVWSAAALAAIIAVGISRRRRDPPTVS